MHLWVFSGVGGGRVGGVGLGVSGGGVGRVGGFVFGVFGLSVVLDISDVAGVVIGLVGDGLSAAIGQQDAVGSRDVALVIGRLLVGVVVVGVVILHGPGEVVGHRGLPIAHGAKFEIINELSDCDWRQLT